MGVFFEGMEESPTTKSHCAVVSFVFVDPIVSIARRPFKNTNNLDFAYILLIVHKFETKEKAVGVMDDSLQEPWDHPLSLL